MHWMLVPYQRYFEFSGRSRRTEYWMFTLFQVLIALAIVVVALVISGPPREGGDPPVLLYGGLGLLILVSFIPSLAVQVRRLHDQGLSGWFVLLGFIPYIGGLIMLVFMCIDGNKGPNKYGDDPKGGVDPNVFS